MNIRITTLSTLALVAASFAVVQPAKAEPHEGMARFVFSPNKFKMEGERTPGSDHYSGPVSNVHSGGAPRSSNFLGVDPTLLAKPPAAAPSFAPAQPQVLPVLTQATPKIIPQTPPTAFNSLFGHPVTPVAQVAQAPRALPPMVQAPAPVSKPLVAHAPSANRNVSGTLLNRKHALAHSAGPAMALPSKPVASYGSGFGYSSGPTTVASSGSGSSTSTNVSGVIMSKRH